jgi:hypothetical protein
MSAVTPGCFDEHPAAAPESGWDCVLAHRPAGTRAPTAARFAAHGVTVDQVRQALDDGGRALQAAAESGVPGWAEPVGGLIGVALLAHEVSVHAEYVMSRAVAARSAAVFELLEEFSAVTVAQHLGVSRQAVFEISRRGPLAAFIAKVWRPL